METTSIHSSEQDLELVTHGIVCYWRQENELRKGWMQDYVLIVFLFMACLDTPNASKDDSQHTDCFLY